MVSSFFDDIVSTEEEKAKEIRDFFEVIPAALYLNLYGTTTKTKLGVTTKDTKVEVQPSSIGVPTSDSEQDLMIYLAKHIPRDKSGKPISKKVSFTGYDFLKVTNRSKSGRGYESLRDSLKRLTETHYTIESTKYTDSRNNPINFKGSLLEDYNWEDSYVVFSDFLYDQLIKVHKNPAKLPDDYFSSSKRSSTLGNKLCQFATLYRYQMPIGPPRKFTLESVHSAINPKTNSYSRRADAFKYRIKNKKMHIPGFDIKVVEEDKLIFTKKKAEIKNKSEDKAPKKARRMFTAKTNPEKLCWENHTRSFRRLLVQNNLHHLLHLNKHEYMNYTLSEAVEHIESKFEPGMNWQNYGPDGWHFDHIRPLSSYKIKGEKDRRLRKALQLENLQPLWAEKNHSKGGKF